MSPDEREAVLEQRMERGGSWRRPPIWRGDASRFLITAACYEHAPLIGLSERRISDFENALLDLLGSHCEQIYAHVVLPNHYHVLVESRNIGNLRRLIGRMHGSTSRMWNAEEERRGRKVFHGSAETRMKSDRHFQATMNYVHHNPVKHGWVQRWDAWPWSSARHYLDSVGRNAARKDWLEYPIDDFGKGWDD